VAQANAIFRHLIPPVCFNFCAEPGASSALEAGSHSRSENRQSPLGVPVRCASMELDPEVCYRALRAKDARFDGRFFIGVKTTKIYCRPICPARPPKRVNLSFHPTAAAAQSAGFRPCLRCRPECSPGVGSWRGTSNTVARGLALIEAGALDEGDVDGLAETLGVGERQLRRLFQKHIGASPIAVAQTRRVHLAKQLIHETQLSMTEIALASGYGSVRRFNEAFRNMFGRPPSQLRRDRATRGSSVKLSLGYRPPLAWEKLLAFLGARATAGVEIVDGDRYRRTFSLDGAVGEVEVSHAPGKNRLEALISTTKLSVIPLAIARVRHLFDLDAEPSVIEAHLGEDPLMRALLRAQPGLRVPGAWDGFELAVRAVLGQQITVGAATELAGRLARSFGTACEASGGLTHLFPTPAQLRRADIAALGMPRARATTIALLAAASMEDPKLFTAARSPEETLACLRSIAGIGEWTAQYIAMRALRETDGFPASDVGLQRAIADGPRPNERQLLARAEGWRPWRAYAALHLWTSERKTHAAHDRTNAFAHRAAAARV
jgi:AraC family transcriptional regulator of adaptative response / DNA-3-methyladenine glycosylase II